MAAIAQFGEDQIDADAWERDRLAALQRFDVLDSPREEAFDRITRLIRLIFDVEVGIVSMIDGHRQWYKSIEGLPISETARNETFCRFPLASGSTMVIPDARQDERTSSSAHVMSEPSVRFYASVPMRTQEGHTIGTVCAIDFKPREFSARETKILEDLALIAMSELELRQRATIDVLTGALSRRAFKEEGARSIALAARHRHRLACIVFDLDFFKTINDSYGHAAGDKVLVDVTRACVSHLRQSDLIGRLGGEEFAVLLPYTDRQSALDVAEKLRSAIQKLTFSFNEQSISVTASFGVSVVDLATKDIDTLLDNADAALYEAKSTGRNRCIASGSATVEPKAAPRRVLKAGKVIFNNFTSSVDCTVRTLSEQGAGIDVSTSFGIPSKFTLAIRSDNFESQCRIVKQTEKHLEVEFC